MQPKTLRTYKYQVGCLLRFTGRESIEQVTQADVDRFRAECDRSPATIEKAVTAVERLTGTKLNGPRLKQPRARVDTVPLDDLSRVYAAAAKRRNIFICRFLKWAYVTGFRLADLLALTRAQMAGDIIELDAAKTQWCGKYHAVPKHPILQRRLPDSAFPLRRSPKALRKRIGYYCELANVPYFTPQMIRRTATTQYELARPGAGAIIQGSGLNGKESVTWRYYIDQVQILTEAQLRLAIPEAMLPKSLATRRRREEQQLVAAFKRISSAERETLLKMIGRLSW